MGGHAKILIIDDDKSIRMTLAAILEEEGYVVDTAENAKEAIEKTNNEVYNLALFDIRLPDMEGTKLIASMKDTTPKMVKIIVTGYPSLQNAAEAVNNGADAYVFKPVHAEKLLKIIKEHLKKQQESGKYSEQKVAEFIETRARGLVHATS